MYALAPFLALLFSLLFLLVGYLAARVFLALVILARHQSFALAGSKAPPLFAPSCPFRVRPLPPAGQGGAALPGLRS